MCTKERFVSSLLPRERVRACRSFINRMQGLQPSRWMNVCMCWSGSNRKAKRNVPREREAGRGSMRRMKLKTGTGKSYCGSPCFHGACASQPRFPVTLLWLRFNIHKVCTGEKGWREGVEWVDRRQCREKVTTEFCWNNAIFM